MKGYLYLISMFLFWLPFCTHKEKPVQHVFLTVSPAKPKGLTKLPFIVLLFTPKAARYVNYHQPWVTPIHVHTYILGTLSFLLINPLRCHKCDNWTFKPNFISLKPHMNTQDLESIPCLGREHVGQERDEAEPIVSLEQGLTASVKNQKVKILGVTDHIQSLLHIPPFPPSTSVLFLLLPFLFIIIIIFFFF